MSISSLCGNSAWLSQSATQNSMSGPSSGTANGASSTGLVGSSSAFLPPVDSLFQDITAALQQILVLDGSGKNSFRRQNCGEKNTGTFGTEIKGTP